MLYFILFALVAVACTRLENMNGQKVLIIDVEHKIYEDHENHKTLA